MCKFLFKKKFEVPPAGCVPSPKDTRDILLSSVQSPIPLRELPENFIIPYQLPILNQNGYPACVGFSAANLKAEKERREQNLIDFDGLWIYQKCKEIDGYNGDGTYLRIVMKVLKDIGAKPLNQLETEGFKYKIGGYASVDNLTFEGLKSAIYQNGVILAGFTGSNQGWQSAYIRPPQRGESTWGHAVSLIGWNKDYIIGQNSWGENWGDEGLFYLPQNYLPFETWAILVDLPDDFKFPEKPKCFFAKDLKIGDRGKNVYNLQKCLKWEGVFPIKIDLTGYFGIITQRAVQNFQATYNIPQTGYVGSQTRAKLNELFG